MCLIALVLFVGFWVYSLLLLCTLDLLCLCWLLVGLVVRLFLCFIWDLCVIVLWMLPPRCGFVTGGSLDFCGCAIMLVFWLALGVGLAVDCCFVVLSMILSLFGLSGWLICFDAACLCWA